MHYSFTLEGIAEKFDTLAHLIQSQVGIILSLEASRHSLHAELKDAKLRIAELEQELEALRTKGS
jgi:hypothetical protein